MAGVGPALAVDGLAGPYLATRIAETDRDYQAYVNYGMRALAADPGNQALVEGLIVAKIALGDLPGAQPFARRLASLDAGNNIAGLVLIANAAHDEDWQKVIDTLDGGATIGRSVDQLLRAWASVGLGRMGSALEIFDALAGDETGGEAALLNKALALALVGDFEGAAKIFSGAEGTLHLSRAGVVAYAQVLSQLERNADAVAMLDATYPDTDDEEILALRAELEAGKPVAFTALSGPREGVAQLFFEVAQALYGDTDPSLVLIYARVAQHLAPEHAGAALLAARVLEDLQKYELAAEAYASVPPDERSYVQAQIGRAVALRRLGKTDAALEVLQALAEAHPDLAQVEATIGDTLRLAERYAEATPHYDKAIALLGEDRPGQWAIYFHRAVTLERQGRWPEAEADFRKALELNPDQPTVLNYLGYSYVERREHLDEALDMIRRAVEARPDDGYIRDSLGWVYYRLGRYDEALPEMERAVELTPLDPILNDHLGDVYWAVGRHREAEFQWRRALSFITDKTDLEELKPDRIRRKLEVGLDKVLEEEGGEAIRK
ncbi:MAG: tetratricopeptide repeat protein [Alphaproteobacteria bacterium]|nr:MAG: tetratricopeptide repeat protein [Alphaproteobacteria bacterium]